MFAWREEPGCGSWISLCGVDGFEIVCKARGWNGDCSNPSHESVTFKRRGKKICKKCPRGMADTPRYSLLNTQHSTLNTQHSTLNTRHPTPNHQPSTLNPQPPTGPHTPTVTTTSCVAPTLSAYLHSSPVSDFHTVASPPLPPTRILKVESYVAKLAPKALKLDPPTGRPFRTY